MMSKERMRRRNSLMEGHRDVVMPEAAFIEIDLCDCQAVAE